MISIPIDYATSGRQIGPDSYRIENWSQHPDEDAWKLFLDRRLERTTGNLLAAHLEGCPRCSRAILNMPSPPYRILGRPAPRQLDWPTEAEQAEVHRLVHVCDRSREAGLVLGVETHLPNESLLLRTVAIAASRMKRRGLAVKIEGFIFNNPEPPPRPEADVTVLLGASMYSELGTWMHRRPGQIVILSSYDQLSPGVHLHQIRCERACRQGHNLRRECPTQFDELNVSDETRVLGMLCAALGCDLPSGFFHSGDPPLGFTHLEDPNSDSRLPWATSVGGQSIAFLSMAEFFCRVRIDFDSLSASLSKRLRTLGEDGRRCSDRLAARLGTAQREADLLAHRLRTRRD